MRLIVPFADLAHLQVANQVLPDLHVPHLIRPRTQHLNRLLDPTLPQLLEDGRRRRRGQVSAASRDHHHGGQRQDLLATGVRLGVDLDLIEFDQHDIRVHLTGAVPLHLGVIGGATGEPDQCRGGRLRLVRVPQPRGQGDLTRGLPGVG